MGRGKIFKEEILFDRLFMHFDVMASSSPTVVSSGREGRAGEWSGSISAGQSTSEKSPGSPCGGMSYRSLHHVHLCRNVVTPVGCTNVGQAEKEVGAVMVVGEVGEGVAAQDQEEDWPLCHASSVALVVKGAPELPLS